MFPECFRCKLTYVYAIFTVQTVFHLVSSEALFGSCIQFNNTAADPAVFKFSVGGLVMKKFVISFFIIYPEKFNENLMEVCA